MAEQIAARLDDPYRFAVKVFTSLAAPKNATAGAASDIDLLLHFTGTDEQLKELMAGRLAWAARQG